MTDTSYSLRSDAVIVEPILLTQIYKLQNHLKSIMSINKPLAQNYLDGNKQRVVINCFNSNWLPIRTRVSRNPIPGPLIFVIFIDDNVMISLLKIVCQVMRHVYILMNEYLNKIHYWLVQFKPNKSETIVIFSKGNKPLQVLYKWYKIPKL